MLACNAAPGCDSFAYNAEQERCFLKTGAGASVCTVRRRRRRATATALCAAEPPLIVLSLELQKPETVCVSARGKPYACGAWQTYFRMGGAGGAGGGNGTRAADGEQAQSALARALGSRNVTAFATPP